MFVFQTEYKYCYDLLLNYIMNFHHNDWERPLHAPSRTSSLSGISLLIWSAKLATPNTGTLECETLELSSCGSRTDKPRIVSTKSQIRKHSLFMGCCLEVNTFCSWLVRIFWVRGTSGFALPIVYLRTQPEIFLVQKLVFDMSALYSILLGSTYG